MTRNTKENKERWLKAIEADGSPKVAGEKIGLHWTGFYFHLRNDADFRRRVKQVQQKKLAAEIAEMG